MAIRLDIDALLIGALYGELDGDDRARLDAHLATHPADRAALDELRATRAFLTEHGARAFLGAAEPPAAVSALVMQEAARRAPAPRKAAGGVFGFLAGLLRPVAAHPALSMAAVAAVVIGVGTMMSKDGRVEVAQPQVEAPAEPAAAAPVAQPAATPDVVPPADPAAGDGLTVTLDDGDESVRDERQGKLEAAAEGKKAPPRSRGLAKPVREQGYLAVDKKDLGADLKLREDADGEGVDDTFTAKAPATAPSGGGAIGQAVAAAPPPPAMVDTQVNGVTVPGASAAIDSWARDQHARMVRLVNDGRCTEAGQIGAEIARKAPDYYQAAVANDRALRSCKAYVDRARRAKAASKPKSEAANMDAAESAK